MWFKFAKHYVFSQLSAHEVIRKAMTKPFDFDLLKTLDQIFRNPDHKNHEEFKKALMDMDQNLELIIYTGRSENIETKQEKPLANSDEEMTGVFEDVIHSLYLYCAQSGAFSENGKFEKVVMHLRDTDLIEQIIRNTPRYKKLAKIMIPILSSTPLTTSVEKGYVPKWFSRYLEKKLPKDIPALHFDTGYSGSIPRWMAENDWDVVDVKLISSNSKSKILPIKEIDGRTLNSLGHNTVVERIEHMPHRIMSIPSTVDYYVKLRERLNDDNPVGKRIFELRTDRGLSWRNIQRILKNEDPKIKHSISDIKSIFEGYASAMEDFHDVDVRDKSKQGEMRIKYSPNVPAFWARYFGAQSAIDQDIKRQKEAAKAAKSGADLDKEQQNIATREIEYELVELLTKDNISKKAKAKKVLELIDNMSYVQLAIKELVQDELEGEVDQSKINSKMLFSIVDLFEAINENDVDKIKLLLENSKIDLNNEKLGGQKALDVAFYQLHINERIVELLLENGADPNQVLDDGLPPIVAAIRQGNVDLIDLLYGYGAIVDNNINGYYPIIEAIAINDMEVVQQISEWADVNVTNEYGVSPLSLAFFKEPSIFRYLIDKANAKLTDEVKSQIAKDTRLSQYYFDNLNTIIERLKLINEFDIINDNDVLISMLYRLITIQKNSNLIWMLNNKVPEFMSPILQNVGHSFFDNLSGLLPDKAISANLSGLIKTMFDEGYTPPLSIIFYNNLLKAKDWFLLQILIRSGIVDKDTIISLIELITDEEEQLEAYRELGLEPEENSIPQNTTQITPGEEDR